MVAAVLAPKPGWEVCSVDWDWIILFTFFLCIVNEYRLVLKTFLTCKNVLFFLVDDKDISTVETLPPFFWIKYDMRVKKILEKQATKITVSVTCTVIVLCYFDSVVLIHSYFILWGISFGPRLLFSKQFSVWRFLMHVQLQETKLSILLLLWEEKEKL